MHKTSSFLLASILCAMVLPSQAADEVQLSLSSKRPGSYAEAASQASTEFRDGDTVWLAIKTPKPLSTYAHAEYDSNQKYLQYYELHVALGPQADLNRDFGSTQCFIKLTPQQAEKTELLLSLAPGMAWTFNTKRSGGKSMGDTVDTHRTKTSCFLDAVAGMSSGGGLWKNRISLRDHKEGSPTEDQALAHFAFSVDTRGGAPRWAKWLADVDNCTPANASPSLCSK